LAQNWDDRFGSGLYNEKYAKEKLFPALTVMFGMGLGHRQTGS